MRRWTLALGLVVAASPAMAIDREERQIKLDVAIVSVTTKDLKDIGCNWGFGGGLTYELGKAPNSKSNTYIRGDFTRVEGDSDIRVDSYGITAGMITDISVTPNGPLQLVLGAGYYETKASDISFTEKKKGMGYEAGVLPLSKGIPVLSVMFVKRPNAFGLKNESLVIMISPTITKFND